MNLVTILDYQPQHQPCFDKFNHRRIEAYFEMEYLDEFIPDNPDEAIIQPGGAILVGLYEGVLAGTVALRKINAVTFEITKMGVAIRFQRKGTGVALIYASLERANRLGAKSVVLYTNSFLKPAIQLYEKVGFKHVPAKNKEYKRADVKMIIQL